MRGKKTDNGLELIALGTDYETLDRVSDITSKLNANTLVYEEMVGKVRSMSRSLFKVEQRGHIDGFSTDMPILEDSIV